METAVKVVSDIENLVTAAGTGQENRGVASIIAEIILPHYLRETYYLYYIWVQ